MALKYMLDNLKKYRFLLKELIKRDFKVKYQRSSLGFLWSILYPLLMMAVMAIVFSNVFRISVPDVSFLAYLLSGLVLFNFFSEATNQGMPSIVGNMSLINKVYIPKYIFPLSKCLFSAINFALTLIPLYGVLILTGTGVTWVHIFLPYTFITLLIFSIGLTFFLACAAVFLRDTFYIYGIFILAWMYLTPIMYPVEILPTIVRRVMVFNPLYQYIDFGREIMLYHRIPELSSWLFCGGFALVMLMFGVWIFRKYQNKFIYYV